MANKTRFTILPKELISRLSLITGHDPQVVRDVINALTEFTLDEVSSGTPVSIGGLGELGTMTYMCNGGYNFWKHEVIGKKMVTKIKFRPSAALKRVVKQTDET